MTPVGRRALLLVNRHARRGAADLPQALQLLRAAGLKIVDPSIHDPRDIDRAIGEHAGRFDLVILGGGDGTMNRSIEAVLKTGVPLGILPMGTANDLARTLGIPPYLDAACRIITDGHTHRIDLGRVNGKHFFNVASMGMSVAIARGLTGDVKQRWGVFGYCMTALEQYRALRPFHAEIDADGRRSRKHSIQLSVGNGRFYGGGMTVSEDALIDDGLLDLYSLGPSTLFRLFSLFPAFRAGRHRQLREIHCDRARRIEVRTRKPMPINTDGEVTTTRTPAVFDVVPRAVEVFVPRTLAAPGLRVGSDAAA